MLRAILQKIALEPLNVRNLARKLQMDITTLEFKIEQLIRRGYIKKTESTKDNQNLQLSKATKSNSFCKFCPYSSLCNKEDTAKKLQLTDKGKKASNVHFK